MKILHVIGYFQPELGYEEYYLAKEQVKQGHDVYVLTSDRIWPFRHIQLSDRKRDIGDVIVDGIKLIRLKSYFEVRDFILFFDIHKNIKNISPDIIHVHEPRQGIYGLSVKRVAKKLNIPYVVDVHEYSMGNIKSMIEYKLFRKHIIKPVLKNAANVLGMTKETVSFLKNVYSVNSIYIPLGANEERFKVCSDSRNSIRKKYNIGENEILFTFTGKITPSKGIEIILNNISQLLKENIPVKLLIVGIGNSEYEKKLKLKIFELNLEKSVIFVSHVEPVVLYKYFNAADVGYWPLSPTISILEALACGLPIIVPNNDITGTLVSNICGVSIDPNNHWDEILTVVNRVLCNSYSRETIRNYFLEKFSYNKIESDIFAIYNESVQSKEKGIL